MRPDILNPLFAEVEALKGVGASLARPLGKLGLARVVDLLFHLPVGWIDRRSVDLLDARDAGSIVTVPLTAIDYRQTGGRGPFRVQAADGAGNIVSLVYFGGNPGWARKLLPLGEARIVSGKLDRYGDELQIVHPDHVLIPAEAEALPEREPVYRLSEGLTNKRMGQLAAQAIARAPELAEWIEPSLRAKHGWPSWHEAVTRVHADPADGPARDRLAYDEIFANQLALMLIR
ncbi:MAG: box helicase, partial [Sphingomonas bacterium]|nr:box helicase [Sphingomonas bacterium]